ncbi:MAG: cytochrome b [Burkholderiales bacterium]
MQRTPERYTNVAIAFHWLLAAALLAQIALGLYLQDVPRATPARAYWVNLHKSCGIALALLVIARIAWRFAHRAPPLPSTIASWERAAANAGHALLYVCMLGLPVTGYIATNFSKYGVKLFGLGEVPPLGWEDKGIYAVFNSAHKALAVLFIALIALHVLAALKHRFIDRDQVLARMLPARSVKSRR